MFIFWCNSNKHTLENRLQLLLPALSRGGRSWIEMKGDAKRNRSEIDRYNAPNARWKQEEEGPSPFVQSLASRHHPEIESRLNGDARQWRAIDTHQLYLWTWIRGGGHNGSNETHHYCPIPLPSRLSLSVYISLLASPHPPRSRKRDQKGLRAEIAASVIDRGSYQPRDSCSTPEESGVSERLIGKLAARAVAITDFPTPLRGRTYVPSRYECRIDKRIDNVHVCETCIYRCFTPRWWWPGVRFSITVYADRPG